MKKIKGHDTGTEGWLQEGRPFNRKFSGITNWDEPWLEVASTLCSVAYGLSDKLVRPKGWRVNALKAAGNALCPQIVEVIGRCILAVEVG